MNYKQNIWKAFSDKKTIDYFRFKSSIFVFVVTNFLFFLSYFFYGANFLYSYSILSIPYLSLLLALSSWFLFFFFIRYKFPNLSIIIQITSFVLFAIFILSLSAFIFLGKIF